MKHASTLKPQKAYITREDITPEIVRELLDYNSETGELTWKQRASKHFGKDWAARSWNSQRAGKPALTAKHRKGYLGGKIFDVGIAAHRAAWCHHFGEWPDGQIDHINGNPADNRIENLRVVSGAENKKNIKRPVNNKSGAIGVCKPKGKRKWKAYISVSGKQVTLGWFERRRDAVAARKEAERELGYHRNHGRSS